MNEDESSAADVSAQRMLLAMELASAPLLDFDAAEVSGLLLEHQPDGELQGAVCAYVAYLRSEGRSPEQVLRAVKQSLARFDQVPETRRLAEAVISLCIEAYYRT